MQDLRERINDEGVLEQIFGEPEPFDPEKLMKKLDEKDVKEVAVFKATKKELDKRINLLAKGQRRKARKKWEAHLQKQKEFNKKVKNI